MIFGKLRRKKPKAPRLARSDFLRLKPVRNPMVEWKRDEEGKVRITIPLKKLSSQDEGRKRRRIGFLFRFFPEPKEKRIQLDEIGSDVWELCDGERTVKDIVDHLCEKYKLLPMEVEVPLNRYLDSLVKRGLIGFILPKDLEERLKKMRVEDSVQR